MKILPKNGSGNKSTTIVYEYIAEGIIINIRQISNALELSFSSGVKVVKSFDEAGILRQANQKEQYR
jgi:hypothetical protein